MNIFIFLIATFFNISLDQRSTHNPPEPIGIEQVIFELDGIQHPDKILLKLKG